MIWMIETPEWRVIVIVYHGCRDNRSETMKPSVYLLSLLLQPAGQQMNSQEGGNWWASFVLFYVKWGEILQGKIA